MDFGPAQIMIVLIIGLLVFGPKRLPELGQSLGNGLREFKGSMAGDSTDADAAPVAQIGGGGNQAVGSDHGES
jgi:sec-independent protein translocase protein TatA